MHNKKIARQPLPPSHKSQPTLVEGQEDLKILLSLRKHREKIERVERKEEDWSLELEGLGGV